MTTNEHILKIKGSASLPEAVDLDQNYTISIDVDITTKTDSKNEDGTLDTIYGAKLITASVIKPNGEVLKSIDKRKASVRLRNAIWFEWHEKGCPGDKEDYYHERMNEIIGGILG